MRKSTVYLSATTVLFLVLALLVWLHPVLTREAVARRLHSQRQWVGRLGLTDICLFTSASYLRHPSLADRFVPFQDHPMAMSHFPAESLLGPPPHLLRSAVPAGRRPAP